MVHWLINIFICFTAVSTDNPILKLYYRSMLFNLELSTAFSHLPNQVYPSIVFI